MAKAKRRLWIAPRFKGPVLVRNAGTVGNIGKVAQTAVKVGRAVQLGGGLGAALNAIPPEQKQQAMKAATNFLVNSFKNEMVKRGKTINGQGMSSPKSKNIRQYGKSLIANGSMSSSSTYFGKVPKLKMISTPSMKYGIFKYNESGTVDLGANYGQQSAVQLSNIFPASTMYSNVGSIAGTNWSSFKTQPLSSQGKLMMNNNDIANSVVDIYEVVARKTQNLGPVTAWANGTSDISASYTPTDLGATPFSIPAFNRVWKVFKRTTVYLSPGCTHTHNFRYGGFRSFTKVDWDSSMSYLAGTSIALMIVASGTPLRTRVSSTDNGTAATTTSTPIITWTVTKVESYRVFNMPDPYYSETNFGGTVVAADAVIREADGEVVIGDQNTVLEN